MQELLKKVEAEIAKRNISGEEIAEILQGITHFTNRRIIGGYCSVSIVDREGQKISVDGLKDAVKEFMSDPHFRNVNVFHSDCTIGRILPRWTNPETGEVYTTHVDDKGWWCVAEIRDDIELADKVWSEIEKGNLRSFSIAGSSKKKENRMEGGRPFEEVSKLEAYEVTVCLPNFEKVWTKRGLINIDKVVVDDYVLTHKTTKVKPSWKKVIKTGSRYVEEKIIKITTEHGFITATKEHPIRTLIFEGKHKGTHYAWKPIIELKEGDYISCHISSKKCLVCNAPLFSGQEKFCSSGCKNKLPNRKNKTITSGDKSAISQSKKMKGRHGKYYYHSPETLKRQGEKMRNNQEFKKKRSQIQTLLWKTPDYAARQCKLQRRRPNKVEIYIEGLLNSICPGEWSYVGDGEFWIDGKNPDFINNKQNKIIEFNGDYWHRNDNNDNTEERINHFSINGYDTLILSDNDIKDISRFNNLIKEFCGNKLSKIIKTEEIPYSGLVYNLEVEDDNSYTTEFAVVHNCEIPVNQLSQFQILWNPNKVSI